MSEFKYDVSFRIFHPNLNPDEICQTLHLQATTKWRSGEQRKTPKGRLLPNVYDKSYCSFKLDQVHDMELPEFLRYWNSRFLKFKEYFMNIHSSGGRLEYFIGWYSKGNSGEVFNVSLLEQLATLKIDLAIDFYSD